MKPVLPQLAKTTTRMTAAAAARPEKMTSQNMEHLPTVLFSYYSPIVIKSMDFIKHHTHSQHSNIDIKTLPDQVGSLVQDFLCSPLSFSACLLSYFV